jgi:MarR family transcriptional regulator, transcriptional regulator for hemolysin
MARAEQHDPANAGSPARPDPSRDLTWLAFQAADALAGAFNQAAREAGLSDLRDWLVLALISDGTDRTQLEIAAELSIDKSTLVPILDRLEKAGLLTRTASQRDRRVRIPRPTPAGQQVVGTVAIARDNAINERLAAIPPDERAAFHATLFSIVRPATP